MAHEFKIKVDQAKISWSSKSMHNCDVQCGLCERPIRDRVTTSVVVHRGKDEDGNAILLPVPQHELPNDPVEWGTFVGSHCAKKIPESHKVKYRYLWKHHSKTWC